MPGIIDPSNFSGDRSPCDDQVFVRLDSVGLHLRGHAILRDVNLTVTGHTTALLGRNGAGKTTLARTLAGAHQAAAGRVSYPALSTSWRRQVGYLPQNPTFFPHVTAAEHVRYTAWLRKVAKRDVRPACSDALDLTNTSHLAHRMVHSLSGGEQRRVALAAAVVNSPALLVLDEPSAGLDLESRSLLRESLGTILHQGGPRRAVVISTHHLDDLIGLGARAVVVAEGTTSTSARLDTVLARSSDAHEIERAYLASLAPHR